MRVGFLNNQIDNRGTGNALYDYAHYNETILGNESIIFILNPNDYDPHMGTKLSRRFTNIYSVWDLLNKEFNLDVLYHIKYGNDDGFRPAGRAHSALYAVHAVFDASQPHGDTYATISRWMGQRFGVDYVPHIVPSPLPSGLPLRQQYNIPEHATVYGRHGGSDTFDISWVWNSIINTLTHREDVYFVFMNTNTPDIRIRNDRVIFIPPTADDAVKGAFIHGCDAMLHARGRGETFGISVGEFAVAGKPVITYANSGERAHIDYLKGQAITYSSEDELTRILCGFKKSEYVYTEADYWYFSPQKVMLDFKDVFLDGNTTRN